MDLIRDILLDIESKPAGELIRTIGFDSEKYTNEEVQGHLRLIDQAGLVDGNLKFHREHTLIAIHGLSNDGHDLLDAIRGNGLGAHERTGGRSGRLRYPRHVEGGCRRRGCKDSRIVRAKLS